MKALGTLIYVDCVMNETPRGHLCPILDGYLSVGADVVVYLLSIAPFTADAWVGQLRLCSQCSLGCDLLFAAVKDRVLLLAG